MQHPAAAERISECTICPPWVIRCAHFDDTVIALGDGHKVAGAIDDGGQPLLHIGRRFAVIDPRTPLMASVVAYTPIFQSDDLDAANAAFDEAEERLLRGDD